jgi:transcriptional regulator with PAS, ATPase and Fis domain
VARIHLPPLRERQEDLPLLLQDFLTELNAKYAAHVTGFSEDCLETFLHYDFPGNIRDVRCRSHLQHYT